MLDTGFWMLVEDPVFKRGYTIHDAGCRMDDVRCTMIRIVRLNNLR